MKEKLSKKNWFIITLFCFMGGMACQKAAQTIINEVGAEVIVPAKNMFLWAGIVCIFASPPLYFLIKKGFETKEPNAPKIESIA